jgi:hypothetical protein
MWDELRIPSPRPCEHTSDDFFLELVGKLIRVLVLIQFDVSLDVFQRVG